MTSTKKLFLTMISAAFAVNVEAATYYVSPAGNDGNAGTSPEAAFLTPQHCADVASAGDTCYFRGGLYQSARTILVTPRSGTVGGPIMFRRYAAEVPVFSGPINVAGAYGIDISGSDWIVIDGLTIVGGEYGILLREGSSHNQLLNNDVSRGHRGGIHLERACSSNLIKANKVYDNSRINWPRGTASSSGDVAGPALAIEDGSNNNVLEDNFVYWNHAQGIVLGKVQSTLVHRNVIADNWRENLRMAGRSNVADKNFIYLSEAAKAWPVIDAENFSNADGITVSIEAPGKPPIGTVQIKNNIVVNTRMCIRGQSDAQGVTFRRLAISNNTCVANDGGIALTYPAGGSSNDIIQNNIITATNAGATPTIQIMPAVKASRLRNNIYYAAATDEFYWADQTPRSFANWTSASGETRSSFADPLLVNAAAVPPRLWNDPAGRERGAPSDALSIENYAPIASSPAVDRGADQIDSLRLTYRGAHRDIGALELCDSAEPEISEPFRTPPVCQATFLPGKSVDDRLVSPSPRRDGSQPFPR